jgi:hypothetical protein
MSKKEFDFCFILSDLLATTPRAFRAVRTLLENGYSVIVVSNVRIKHAVGTDEALISTLPKGSNFQIQKLEWRFNNPAVILSKIFHKISKFLFGNLGFNGSLVTSFAMDYTIDRQLNAARNIRAKVYVGHRPATLPIVHYLSEKYHAASWFDIEDEHFIESVSEKENRLVKEIITNNPVKYYTNASRLVGESFCKHLNFSSNRSIEILNSPTVKIPESTIQVHPTAVLSFVWFSQSVTFGRGLEEFFDALKIAAIPAHIYLVGQVFPEFKEWLIQRKLSHVEIEFLGFIPEEEIINVCLKSDIGLALERDDVDESRNLTITNKILTYAVCGNFILASRTNGQMDFMERLPECGMVTTLKMKALADVLLTLHFEKASLRENAVPRLQAAKDFRWDNQEKVLLEFVKTIV